MKKIKSQKCESYELTKTHGKTQKKLKKRNFCLYDRYGKILERISFKYFNYTYEKTRSLRSGVWQIHKYFKKPLTEKVVCLYNGKNLVAEHIFRPMNHLTQKITYQYDSQSRLCYSKYFNLTGEVLWENQYKYDNLGHRREWIAQNYSLNDVSKWKYRYDSKGRKKIVECESTFFGNNFYEYKFDKNNNIVEEAYYRKPDILEELSRYFYNEKGQKIKFEFFHAHGKSGGYVLYVRDNHENSIESKEYNERLLHITKTEYNKHNHLTSSLYINYYCDCRGVRVVPYQLDILKYEYYQNV